MMKVTRIAGPFLDGKGSKDFNKHHNVYETAKDRKPIITPFISANNSSEGQQYVLVPGKDCIQVLSYEHGQKVCDLVPNVGVDDAVLNTAMILKMNKGSSSNEEENGDANAMEVDTNIFEYTLVAGFSNGSILEWNLSSIPYAKNTGNIPSRRNFTLDRLGGSVTHLTSPTGNGSLKVYAIVQSEEGESGSALVKFLVPVCDEVGEIPPISTEQALLISSKGVEQKKTEEEVNTVVLKSQPFALLSSTAEKERGKMDHFVTVVNTNCVVTYHENTDSFVSLPSNQTDTHICSAALSPNGEDIALGFENGKIDILTSVLTQISDYLVSADKSKKDPSCAIVSRTVHWHSLPVKTLAYLGSQGSRATPTLLSGGEEGVLVTWSIDRGLNRPSHTLARIARGCITHVATSSTSGSTDIIIRSMDGTISLIHGHNHSTRWRVQGLALALNECVVPVGPIFEHESNPIINIDPRSNVPVLTRLNGAPGYMHWFDPKANQVIGELAVADYNRISRKERNHKSYPRPTVSLMAMSSTGNDIVTIERMLSENNGVGHSCKVDSYISESGNDLTETMSYVTQIKFWTWSREMEKNANKERSGMPYELIAAMPAPHGLTNGSVDALDISPDGTKACTLSLAENEFHIWTKGRSVTYTPGSSVLSAAVPSWKRLCRIGIPSGYVTGKEEGHAQKPITFSSDGSVLAIAFGHHITLWDHAAATMLNTIQAPEEIDSISFIKAPTDMILVVGKSSISVLPPFGNAYLGNGAWSYVLPESNESKTKISLSNVTCIASRKEIAVAFNERANAQDSTKIILVDLMTGQAKRDDEGAIFEWRIRTKLISMTDISQIQSNWASDSAVLLGITEDQEILIFETDSSEPEPIEQSEARGCFANIENTAIDALSSVSAPKLASNKRQKTEQGGNGESKRKTPDPMAGSLLFGFDPEDSEATHVPTALLPALSGSLTRSFMVRNVRKTS